MPRKPLRDRNPGKVTLQQIAKLAETTTATVSRALSGKPGISEEFRETIVNLADKHGYIPNQLARNMVSGSSNFIGFLASDLNNPFYVAVFRVLENLCREADLSLLIADSEKDPVLEKQHITQFLRMNVRGIALFPVFDWDSTTGTEHFGLMTKRSLPVVALGHVQIPGISTVVTEEWRAAVGLVAELRAQGHSRFLLVGPGEEFNIQGHMRRSAILSSLNEEVAGQIDSDQAGWEDSVIALLKNGEEAPTAIIAVSDVVALQLYRPLMRSGIRVPEGVSLAAFGCNLWAPHIFPSLSLSEPNAGNQAKAAFNILLEKIKDPESADQHIVVPQTFHQRDSIAAPVQRGASSLTE